MLTQLITKLFTGEASIFIARLRSVAIVYALMGLFALATVGFLLNALHAWLSFHYGPVATSVGFAPVSLAVLVGLYVVLVTVRRPPRVRAQDRMQRDIASIASVAAVSNIPLLFTSVRRRKSLLLVPVAAAGLFGLWRSLRGMRGRI